MIFCVLVLLINILIFLTDLLSSDYPDFRCELTSFPALNTFHYPSSRLFSQELYSNYKLFQKQNNYSYEKSANTKPERDWLRDEKSPTRVRRAEEHSVVRDRTGAHVSKVAPPLVSKEKGSSRDKLDSRGKVESGHANAPQMSSAVNYPNR